MPEPSRLEVLADRWGEGGQAEPAGPSDWMPEASLDMDQEVEGTLRARLAQLILEAEECVQTRPSAEERALAGEGEGEGKDGLIESIQRMERPDERPTRAERAQSRTRLHKPRTPYAPKPGPEEEGAEALVPGTLGLARAEEEPAGPHASRARGHSAWPAAYYRTYKPDLEALSILYPHMPLSGGKEGLAGAILALAPATTTTTTIPRPS